MVAPRLVPVLQGLVSTGLFLDAMTSGAITPLLPYIVARFGGSEQTVANLLAVGYGATLAAMLPSTILLLNTGHLPMLTLGITALLVSCALLAVPHSLWQLYGAMVLTGFSAEFLFAAALAMVTKLHSSGKGSDTGSPGEGGSVPALEQAQVASPQPKVMGRSLSRRARAANIGNSFRRNSGAVELLTTLRSASVIVGGRQSIRALELIRTAALDPKRAFRGRRQADVVGTGSGDGSSAATDAWSPERLDSRRHTSPVVVAAPAKFAFPRNLTLVKPNLPANLPSGLVDPFRVLALIPLQDALDESDSAGDMKQARVSLSDQGTGLQKTEKQVSGDEADGLTQGVGLLFAAQSLGYVFGPFLVLILYGLVDAWLPCLIIVMLTSAILGLILLLSSSRVVKWVMGGRVVPVDATVGGGHSAPVDCELGHRAWDEPGLGRNPESEPSSHIGGLAAVSNVGGGLNGRLETDVGEIGGHQTGAGAPQECQAAPRGNAQLVLTPAAIQERAALGSLAEGVEKDESTSDSESGGGYSAYVSSDSSSDDSVSGGTRTAFGRSNALARTPADSATVTAEEEQGNVVVESPNISSNSPPETESNGRAPSVLRSVAGLLLSAHAFPAVLVVFAEAVVMGAVDTVVPLFLMDTCHVSAAESGLIFGALALAYAGAAYWATTWMVGAVGDIHTMVLGAAAMGVVLPVMAMPALCALWAQMLVMIPIGFGMALMGGPTFPRLVSALKLKGSDDEGVAVVLYDGLYSGGMVLGPFVGLALKNATSSATVLQILSGGLALMISAIYCVECFVGLRGSKGSGNSCA